MQGCAIGYRPRTGARGLCSLDPAVVVRSAFGAGGEIDPSIAVWSFFPLPMMAMAPARSSVRAGCWVITRAWSVAGSRQLCRFTYCYRMELPTCARSGEGMTCGCAMLLVTCVLTLAGYYAGCMAMLMLPIMVNDAWRALCR